jgi:hypothetical protein
MYDRKWLTSDIEDVSHFFEIFKFLIFSLLNKPVCSKNWEIMNLLVVAELSSPSQENEAVFEGV